MAGKLLRTIDDNEFYAKYAAHAGKDINGVPLEDRELLYAELEDNKLTLESIDDTITVNVVPPPSSANKVLKSTGAGKYRWETAAEQPGDGALKLKLGNDAPVASGFTANSADDITVAIPGATENKFGLMSPEDKVKLDNVSSGATKVEILETTKNGQIAIDGVDTTVYTHPTPMQESASLNMYKFRADRLGHIQEVYLVRKADIVALGIPAQDTTYESLPAEEGGTDVSLVTTGEKHAWNGKYEKPSTGIPGSDLDEAVRTALGKAENAYQKPSGGIPKSDLASAVQTSLNKANTAIQGVGEQGGGIYPVVDGIARIPPGTLPNDAKLYAKLGTSSAQQIFTANSSIDATFSIPLASKDSSGYTEGLVGQPMFDKVAGIEDGAQENVIEEIKVNGTTQPITNKSIDIDLGTWTSGTYNIPAVATP